MVAKPQVSKQQGSKPPAESRASLQETLSKLTRFWTEDGCVWLPSCDFGVVAGTYHPDSFFRLLDQEPFRAVFFQPVRRPLDGRRREHPYRLYKHLQLQVVIKPPPDDLQALYLQSLDALGLELEAHDVRFAEWNWQSTALDAWGSGWHVLIDGLGVTRLTFLQQAAGQTLENPTVELSYGVERLTMLLAGKPSAADLEWKSPEPVYGDLRRADEAELSRYAFAVADVGWARRQLDDLMAESDRCLEAGLLRPAYELAVQSLQALDVLEARGDLTAFERRQRLLDVAARVRAAAGLYTESLAPAADSEAASAADDQAAEASEKASEEPTPTTDSSASEPKKKPRSRARGGKTRRRRKRGTDDGE